MRFHIFCVCLALFFSSAPANSGSHDWAEYVVELKAGSIFDCYSVGDPVPLTGLLDNGEMPLPVFLDKNEVEKRFATFLEQHFSSDADTKDEKQVERIVVEGKYSLAQIRYTSGSTIDSKKWLLTGNGVYKPAVDEKGERLIFIRTPYQEKHIWWVIERRGDWGISAACIKL